MSYRATVSNPAALGLALQQARLAARMTQRDLAQRIGTSQRYIWELESGKESAVLTRLIDALRETGATMYVDVPEGDDE